MNDDKKGSTMLKVLTTLGVAVAGLVLVPAGAHAATHTGTDGDDVFNLYPGDTVTASPGNDTYNVMEIPAGDPADGTVDEPIRIQGADAGSDTVSLANLPGPYSEQFADNGYGGMFGFWLLAEADAAETIVFTAGNDHIGRFEDCGLATSKAPITFELGDGNDIVDCKTGDIKAGAGDDTVRGNSHGTTIDLGTGNDTAETDEAIEGSVQTASFAARAAASATQQRIVGGLGYDVIETSPNDTYTGVELVNGARPFVAGVTKVEYNQVKLGWTKARVHRVTDVTGTVVDRWGNKEKRVYKGWKRGVKVYFVFQKKAGQPWTLIRKSWTPPSTGV